MYQVSIGIHHFIHIEITLMRNLALQKSLVSGILGPINKTAGGTPGMIHYVRLH